jgi:hypothetical protein
MASLPGIGLLGFKHWADAQNQKHTFQYNNQNLTRLETSNPNMTVEQKLTTLHQPMNPEPGHSRFFPISLGSVGGKK